MKSAFFAWTKWEEQLPLALGLLLLVTGGLFLLHRSDGQARDTIRKHHLADIEVSLQYARRLHGTYPPYNQPTWCGLLGDKTSQAYKEIDEALRSQNEQYKNMAKPFPADPKFANTPQDYFYWKRSPASFELYAVLEQDKTGEKSTAGCAGQTWRRYDYGLTSVLREQ